MNKILKVLLLKLLILTFIQCASSNKIKVEGVARNAKAGAVVLVSDEMVYYIENLDEWDDKYYNKKILVKGELDSIITVRDSTDKIPAQIIYNKYIIKNARYRIIRRRN